MAKKLEIERKYLLKRLPHGLKWDGVLHIFQYYLPDGRRVRETRNALVPSFYSDIIPFPFGRYVKYEVCIKKKLKAGVYEEDEKKITQKQFEKLKELATSSISKTRHIFKMGKLKWEIDEYQRDINLVTAEIELKTEKTKFKMPKELQDVLIMDVTEFREFTNKSLADAYSQHKLYIKA